ncbi:MAG: hypothetical protein R3F43_13240 [bacterium]
MDRWRRPSARRSGPGRRCAASTPPCARAQGGDITIAFEPNWDPEFGATTAGITFTTRRGGVISAAQILLNARDFQWTTRPQPGLADVQGIATHEVGHAIGLGPQLLSHGDDVLDGRRSGAGRAGSR